VRVPCLGWVSLYQIFKALELGADGVLLVGCMPEQCQHLKGVEYAEQTMRFAKDILNEIGLGSSRLKMVNVCAANPKAFSSAAESLVSELKGFKPIPKTKIERVSVD
jgi:coenzyme F420-reducing hydrogenase delta subunit